MLNYRRPQLALLVFAKAPIEGQVKTRLIPPLSPAQATALHRKLVWRTLQSVCLEPLAAVTLYGAPDDGHPFFAECRQAMPIATASQQGADLGQRMHHALESALEQQRYAILIGSDCPQMNLAYIESALERLQKGADLVLGPALDGGYVLIGMRRPQRQLFEGIQWGTDQVLSQTLDKAYATGLQVSLLDAMQDIDRPEDLSLLHTMQQA